MSENNGPAPTNGGAAGTPSSDQPSGQAAGQPGQQRQRQIPLMIRNQYVKDLSFENPRAPNALPQGQQPQMQVEVDVEVNARGANDHEVALSLNVTAKSGEETLFLIELHYAGLFQVANMPDEMRDLLLYIEGGRMLFPFARAIIANVTRDGALPPVLLAPMDFAALYQQKTGKPLPTFGAAQGAPGAGGAGGGQA